MSEKIKIVLKWISWGLLSIVFCVLIYKAITLSKKLDERDSRLYKLDSLRVIDSTKYAQAVEDVRTEKQIRYQLEVQNKNLADNEEIKNNTIRLLNQTVLQLKSVQYTKTYVDTQYIPVLVADSSGDYIKVPVGGDTVMFAEDYGRFLSIQGKTWLYPAKNYVIDLTGKQITLDIVMTEDDNGIWNSFIDVNDPILSVIKFNTKINRVDHTKSFWSNLSGMVGANLTNKSAFIDAGLSYSKIGVKGILGFIYSNYNTLLDKGNLMYGGGIYFNF